MHSRTARFALVALAAAALAITVSFSQSVNADIKKNPPPTTTVADLKKQGFGCETASVDLIICSKTGSKDWWCSNQGQSCTVKLEDGGTTVPPPPETTIPMVTVPDVVGLSATTAGSTLRAAGLGVIQQSRVDDICEGIGAVLNESPGGGASVPAGSNVTITIGTRPKHPCP
jgi:hypothetical protein